jgi:hypothetical protein
MIQRGQDRSGRITALTGPIRMRAEASIRHRDAGPSGARTSARGSEPAPHQRHQNNAGHLRAPQSVFRESSSRTWVEVSQLLLRLAEGPNGHLDTSPASRMQQLLQLLWYPLLIHSYITHGHSKHTDTQTQRYERSHHHRFGIEPRRPKVNRNRRTSMLHIQVTSCAISTGSSHARRSSPISRVMRALTG